MSSRSTVETLRLTPIEKFWLAVDRPEAFLSFFHKYELSSPVDESRLRTAIKTVSRIHRLPFCRLESDEAGIVRWIAGSNDSDSDHQIKNGSPEPYRDAHSPKLFEESGIRIWFWNSTIWFQYHHICADGRGALKLERDFFQLYASNTNKAKLDCNDSCTLANAYSTRTRVPITLTGAILRSTYGFWFLWRGLNAKVISFTRPESSIRSTKASLTSITRRLDRIQTKRVIEKAHRSPHSLNDFILAIVLDAIKQQHGDLPADSSGVFRIAIPIDLRNDGDTKLPCANKISFLYVDMRPSEVDSLKSLTIRITRRIRFLKRHMGLVLWRSIKFGPKTPGRLHEYLGACNMSCFVSNLGDIVGFPKFVVGFEATPTLQVSDTPAGLMAYTFNEQLNFTFGYEASRISQVTAERFIQQVIQGIDLVGEPAPNQSLHFA